MSSGVGYSDPEVKGFSACVQNLQPSEFQPALNGISNSDLKKPSVAATNYPKGFCSPLLISISSDSKWEFQSACHKERVGALVLVYLSCTLFLNFLISLHLLFGLPLVYTQTSLSATEDLLLPSSKASPSHPQPYKGGACICFWYHATCHITACPNSCTCASVVAFDAVELNYFTIYLLLFVSLVLFKLHSSKWPASVKGSNCGGLITSSYAHRGYGRHASIMTFAPQWFCLPPNYIFISVSGTHEIFRTKWAPVSFSQKDDGSYLRHLKRH